MRCTRIPDAAPAGTFTVTVKEPVALALKVPRAQVTVPDAPTVNPVQAVGIEPDWKEVLAGVAKFNTTFSSGTVPPLW